MNRVRVVTIFAGIVLCGLSAKVSGQCGGIMEPGFAFLTSSRGCSPFTVNIETLYLSSVPGTQYYIDWGDGSPEETFTQTGATGVVVSHTYLNTTVECGYDVTIDAANACNPRGSVVPIETQVVVWTNDVIFVDPVVYRVCQGFAADVLFTDNSDWNCFPRLTRENNEPRWIQWIYGTGAAGIRIPGIQIDGVSPSAFPYLDPAPVRNPIYPVTSPGQISLPVNVPVTSPADLGKEFEITLKNWNQCNPYDENVLDGNAFNPVGGDLINGDNPPQMTEARIVVVPSPQPNFVTRLVNASGPLQTIFCSGDNIYFDNETPPISGAAFKYTWEFFDNDTGTGIPLATSTSTNPVFAYATPGQKLIRLSVRDDNAAGNCIATFDNVVTISLSPIASIAITDLMDNPMVPYFCQNVESPLESFDVRFADMSTSVTATTQWRWEFYDENNTLIREEPAGGGFSGVQLGPFDEIYSNPGIYHVKLIVRDNATSCQSEDEVEVRVYPEPDPLFSASRVCEGNTTHFEDASTLNALNGESIVLREWDFNYDGMTFNKDPGFDNQIVFDRILSSGPHQVALRVTTDQNGCSAIAVLPVIVDPLPVASFTPDTSSGCSPLTVTFINNSIAGQPDAIESYQWEVDEKSGAGFQVVAVEDPSAPGFDNIFSREFENVTTGNRTYDIRLVVKTVNGCTAVSPTSTITVFPGTQSGFLWSNYSPFDDNCSPQTINFLVDGPTQSLNPADYSWRISDSGGIITEISSGSDPTFSYNFINNTQSIKNFSVTLTTTLSSGCGGDSTLTVRINPVPRSDFSIDTLLFDCEVMNLSFSALQKGLPEYHWVVKENGTTVYDNSGAQDKLNYDFNRPHPGALNLAVEILLETTNFAGCPGPVATRSVLIPPRDDMSVSFDVDPQTQTFPASTVNISNHTNAGQWTYLWNFGDGNTSTEGNVGSHTYETFGTYVISLTVSSDECIESHTETIVINPIPPVVDFEYNPADGCAPLTVHFTNLSLYADPDTYAWRFGDGQAFSNEKDPSYTYHKPGKYTVSLSASNLSGETVTEVKQQIINVYPTPGAVFEITPTIVYIPGGSVYTNNMSFNATQFEWDFGDGTKLIDFEPQHVYQKEGEYSIRLIASNSYGCSDTTIVESAVRAVANGQMLIPNAFSPGGLSGNSSGDGKNDVFVPLTRNVNNYHLLIFNRWGELMFESFDPQSGWNGYHNGKLCQQDVYVYKITGNYGNGEPFIRVGDVNLIR